MSVTSSILERTIRILTSSGDDEVLDLTAGEVELRKRVAEAMCQALFELANPDEVNIRLDELDAIRNRFAISGAKTAVEIVAHVDQMHAIIRNQSQQLAELEAWKAEQLAVESEWNPLAVARALGIPVGKSILQGILPAIQAMKSGIADLERQLAEARAEAARCPNPLYGWLPQTYGEAVIAGWIQHGDVEPHEWDNRTTAENAKWMIEHLAAQRSQLRGCIAAAQSQYERALESFAQENAAAIQLQSRLAAATKERDELRRIHTLTIIRDDVKRGSPWMVQTPEGKRWESPQQPFEWYVQERWAIRTPSHTWEPNAVITHESETASDQLSPVDVFRRILQDSGDTQGEGDTAEGVQG